MYEILGWINAAVITIIFIPILLEKMATYDFLKSDNLYIKILLFLRKLHKPFGLIIFIFVILHGILALGSFRLHTGSILGFLFILTAGFAILHAKLEKPWAFIMHKVFAYLTVLMMIVHLVFPSLFYTIFRI